MMGVRCEKMQDKSNKVKPKVSKLKRPKRPEEGTGAPSLVGTDSNCKDVLSEPTVNQNFSTKNLRHLNTKPGVQLSPKRHLLSLSLKQTKLQLISTKHHLPPCIPVTPMKSDPDKIDLCGVEDGDHHPEERLQKPKDQRRDSSKNIIIKPNVQLQPPFRDQSVTEKTFPSPFSAGIPSPNHDAMFQRSDMSLNQTSEELLEQIHAQDPHFPVRRFFSLLMKRHRQCKSDHADFCELRSAPEVLTTGKRKRDVEALGNERLQKRWRSQVNPCENPARSRSGGRLSISRRKLRQKTSAKAAYESRDDEDKTGGNEVEEGDLRGGDVLWTEKYRPRCSEEVVGNSAAVRKLHSWLKEWRMRADVEERRKRREEQRMQEEDNAPSDCGDFVGEAMMEACSSELCNTVLIHGPTGVGKTAAVYACAHELGFKVFEVNSSSVRSGHLVLSQLRESTQSHQVGAPHTPAASIRKEAPVKSVPLQRTPSVISRGASRKKTAAAPSLTLQHFFKNSSNRVQTRCNSPLDTQVVEVEVTGSGLKDSVSPSKDAAQDRKDRRAPVSLILFEEVDVVFNEDVGFLSAVKTLMSTTKRPVILTSNDPFFGRSFEGHLKEIRFRPPAKTRVKSYLQCVCVVEGVRPDPQLIDAMMQENKGDVRRSVLQLELWVRSGAGNDTHALTRSSYAELESLGCAELLVESWMKGQGFLYSNLDLLVAPPPSETAVRGVSEQNAVHITVQNKPKNHAAPDQMRPGKLSRLRGRREDLKMRHANEKQTCQSAGGSSELESFAQFFSTMSFSDSYLFQERFCCKSGAQICDGLLDEPREEEMRTLGMESLYEIQAVVEGLGFHRCRTRMCEMNERRKEDGEGRMDKKLAAVRCEKTTWESSVCLKSPDAVQNVLYCKAFRYHSNKTAVITEYLPTVRFICAVEHARHQNKPRFSHYLEEIGLVLPKSTLNSVALELR